VLDEECLTLFTSRLTSINKGIVGIQSILDLVSLLCPLYKVYMVSFVCHLFFLFCAFDAVFPTMQTSCDFGVGEGKLCFRFLKNKKNRIFLKKIKKIF